MGAIADRQSNFELLRIIAMLFIILHHVSIHGGWGNGGVFSPEDITIGALYLQGLLPLGKIGVDLFVLITGYFLYASSKSTWPKAMKLWLEMLFYSMIIPIIFTLWGDHDITSGEFLSMITPAVHSTWWFATSYLILLILTPFVNKMLSLCDERDCIKLIAGSLLIWCVIPTIISVNTEFSNIAWFIILYTIGAFIARFPIHFRSGPSRYLPYATGAYVILLLSFYVADVTGFTSELLGIYNPVDHLIAMNSIPCVIIASAIFIAFSKMPMKNNIVINTIAASTFGIYLIHDHYLVRGYIYSDVFDCFSWTGSDLLIPYTLSICAAIFVVCSIEELIRMATVGRYIINPLSRRAEDLQKKIDSLIDRHITGNIHS